MSAQSLNNKAGEFADFVCKYKPDVVAIMETWFHEIESASRTLCTSPGYNLFDHLWSNCTEGGTGVLFIDTLNVTKIAAAEFQPFEYSEWNIKSESEQIHLIFIYIPPYSEVHPVTTSVFVEEFLEFLESTVFTASHLLITRDFNIHIDVTDDPDALRLHDLLESTGLEQHVTVPTHIILFLYSMDQLSLLRSLTSPL